MSQTASHIHLWALWPQKGIWAPCLCPARLWHPLSYNTIPYLHLECVHGLFTSRMRLSRGEMCIGHTRLSVWLSIAAFPHYCTDPDVTWGNGRGCTLVVHYWADLQSVHGFHCYDNIAMNVRLSLHCIAVSCSSFYITLHYVSFLCFLRYVALHEILRFL